MSIAKDLEDLEAAGVIDAPTAARIQRYYDGQTSTAGNRMMMVFGILGALLVGLGIILIIAHNWDNLSKTSKTIFAFVPLVAGQAMCIYALLKKSTQTSWREATAVFLFFAVGASISLISQIYHLEGSLSSFLITWLLLCIPAVYLLRSSVLSLLCWVWTIALAWNLFDSSFLVRVWPWFFFAALLPYYWQLWKRNILSNFATFHHWIIPVGILSSFATLFQNFDELITVAYFALLTCIFIIGSLPALDKVKAINNGYRTIGVLGTVFLLLLLSFRWFWKDVAQQSIASYSLDSIANVSILVLIGAVIVLFYIYAKNRTWKEYHFVPISFFIFIPLFVLGHTSIASYFLMNVLTLLVGIHTIWNGAERQHLGMLNLGLGIISLLILSRFFDANISFVWRGIIFIMVGIGFFVTNSWMLKKKKTDAIEL